MTRKDMEQCISLRHEIKAIEASMRSPKSSYVVVFYKDYRTGRGIPKAKQEVDNGEEERRMMYAYLKKTENKLKKRLKDAEKFIASIEDSEMRTILRMYYINGETQKDIGEMLHYTRSSISQKINAFWMKQMSDARKK